MWENKIPKHMGCTEVVLKEKFIAINAYIKNKRRDLK